MNRLIPIAQDHFIEAHELRLLAANYYDRVTAEALSDQLLTREEETRLVVLQRELGLRDDEVASSRDMLIRAAILRSLDEGESANRFQLIGYPVVVARDEMVQWAFDRVSMSRFRSRTHFAGGSSGISLRVMRGVYLRFGQSRGQRIQTEELTLEDQGQLVVTNRNVIFSGPQKSMRIRANKIVSVNAFDDGIALMKESASPKPIFFTLDDPWFATNLILKVAAL